MKITIIQIVLNLLFASIFFYPGHAQEKLGGNYDVTLKKAYCAEFKDSINWLYIAEPDSMPNTTRDGIAEQVGFGIPINKNFFELATKLETAGNEYSFLLRITQEKAFFTALFFNEYFLPEGPELSFHDTNGIRLDENVYTTYDFNTIYNHANNYYTYYHEKGFTQKGSSGSPVFDNNHLLIGLIGGGDNNATCSNPNDPVGPKFSYIFPNIKQYLGTTEKTAYFYDPNYAHTPGHCKNCVTDYDLGEIHMDCGGPCKPRGQVITENLIIDDSRNFADLIQSKTLQHIL